MTPQELLEYQRKLLELIYGGRKADPVKLRYWAALHLVFGNGSEETRIRCESMTDEEKDQLIKEFCI